MYIYIPQKSAEYIVNPWDSSELQFNKPHIPTIEVLGISHKGMLVKIISRRSVMYHDVPKAPHHWTMKYPRFLHVPHCSTARCCILNGCAVGHYRIRTSSGWILDHENTYSSFQQSHTPKYYSHTLKNPMDIQWNFPSSMRLKAPTRKVIVSAVASPSASGSFTKPPATTSTKASPRMWKRMGEQFWCWKQQHFSKGSKVRFNIIVYQLSSFWETLHIRFSTLVMLSFQSILFTKGRCGTWILLTVPINTHVIAWAEKSKRCKKKHSSVSDLDILELQSPFWQVWSFLTHQHRLQEVIRCQIELVWEKKGDAMMNIDLS